MSNQVVEVLGPFFHTSGKPILLNRDRRRRQRRPSLTTAMRQAGKAGATVAGVEIKPDGSFALAFGKATAESSAVENEWDTVQ